MSASDMNPVRAVNETRSKGTANAAFRRIFALAGLFFLLASATDAFAWGPGTHVQLATDLLVFTIGWIPARLHLAIGNATYLRAGSLEEPHPLTPSPGAPGEGRGEGLVAPGNK